MRTPHPALFCASGVVLPAKLRMCVPYKCKSYGVEI